MAEASTTLTPSPATADWREMVRRWPLQSVATAALVGLAAGRTLGRGGPPRGPDGSFLRPQEAAMIGRGIQTLVGQARSWLEDLEHRMKEER